MGMGQFAESLVVAGLARAGWPARKQACRNAKSPMLCMWSSPPSPASSPGPGSRHCPYWLRILAAIDLEMRITLEVSDNHDDVVDAQDNRLSADQRAARRPTRKTNSPPKCERASLGYRT